VALLFDITEMYTPLLKLQKSRNYEKNAVQPAVISEGENSLGISDLNKFVGLSNSLL
jgi:hypothetical protein